MDIYNSNSSPIPTKNKRKFALISLNIFLVCVVIIGLSIFFDKNISQLFSDSVYKSYGRYMSFIVFVGSASLLFSTSLVKNKILKIILWLIFGPIAFLYLLSAFVMRPHKVLGNSMFPKLVNKEYILGSPISYYLSSPRRGDIVVFIAPDNGKESIDRVVGLPGEKISIKKGQVYINDKLLEEPYISGKFRQYDADLITEVDLVIPENQYAILGDNRDHSGDSRYYGFITRSAIKEKIFYSYWPSDRAGFVKPD